MNWGDFSSAIFIGLREAIEALLIVIIVIVISKKLNIPKVNRHAIFASLIGLVSAIAVGVILYIVTAQVKFKVHEKLVEGIIAAAIFPLILYFVFFMLKYNPKAEKQKMELKLNNKKLVGLYFIIIFNVFREFLEIILFILPKESSSIWGAISGVILAGIIFASFRMMSIKIKFGLLLNILIWFLIVQTAYIFGSIFRYLGEYAENTVMTTVIWDVKQPFLSNKDGWLGIILNVFIGWRSKMLLIPFIMQITMLLSLVSVWFLLNIKRFHHSKKLKPILDPQL